MAQVTSTAPLWKVEKYLGEHGPSYPSHIAIDIGASVSDTVKAITYLERQKKLTRYIGGKFGLFDAAVGVAERDLAVPTKKPQTKKKTNA